jgi:hypothetical protein
MKEKIGKKAFQLFDNVMQTSESVDELAIRAQVGICLM